MAKGDHCSGRRSILLPLIGVWFVLVLLTGFFGVAPYATAQAPWPNEMLVGRWYSERPTVERQKVQTISNRRADGTYDLEQRIYDGCVLKRRYTEAGTWKFDGKIYTKRTLSIGSVPIERVDVYQFSELNERFMSYLHIAGQVKFTADKVDSEFKFQSCVTS